MRTCLKVEVYLCDTPNLLEIISSRKLLAQISHGLFVCQHFKLPATLFGHSAHTHIATRRLSVFVAASGSRQPKLWFLTDFFLNFFFRSGSAGVAFLTNTVYNAHTSCHYTEYWTLMRAVADITSWMCVCCAPGRMRNLPRKRSLACTNKSMCVAVCF